MDSVIVIPGEPEPHRNSLLSTEWIRRAMIDRMHEILNAEERWQAMRRVWELRQSCGLPPSQGTVSVRIPFRYVKDC